MMTQHDHGVVHGVDTTSCTNSTQPLQQQPPLSSLNNSTNEHPQPCTPQHHQPCHLTATEGNAGHINTGVAERGTVPVPLPLPSQVGIFSSEGTKILRLSEPYIFPLRIWLRVWPPTSPFPSAGQRTPSEIRRQQEVTCLAPYTSVAAAASATEPSRVISSTLLSGQLVEFVAGECSTMLTLMPLCKVCATLVLNP